MIDAGDQRMRFDFLVASERSGSNLITKVLNAHPEICAPFPSHAFRFFGLNRFRYGDLTLDENWNALVDDILYFFENLFCIWMTRPTREDLADINPRSLPAALRTVYEKEARALGKRRLFVKENHTYRIAPMFLAHFPESRFVYLVRDPRDMAATWKELMWRPPRLGVQTAARIWLEDQRESQRLVAALRDIGRAHSVRFDDLVLSPRQEVESLCRFLKVPYDEAMLRFCEDGLVTRNAALLAGWRDLAGPIDPRQVGKYKAMLTETEHRFVEAICAPLMKELGYTPTYADPGDAEALEAALPDEATTPKDFDLTEEAEKYKRYLDAIRRIEQRTPPRGTKENRR